MYDVKTRNSNRRIDLGPFMMADLKRWKIACPPNELNLIFPNAAGQPMNHSNMTARHFFPALKRAGVKRIRFHDLRHTKVSLMLDHQEAAKRFENAVLIPTGHKMVTGDSTTTS